MPEDKKPVKKIPPRHGDIATVYFTNAAGSGPMFVDAGEKLEVVEKLMGFRIQKKDGRAYYIPYHSVAFIRFEPRAEEETEVPK